MQNRKLRTPEAAQYLGASESTLNKKRCSGDGPAFSKLGRIVVYDTRDLDAYVERNRRNSTSERPA